MLISFLYRPSFVFQLRCINSLQLYSPSLSLWHTVVFASNSGCELNKTKHQVSVSSETRRLIIDEQTHLIFKKNYFYRKSILRVIITAQSHMFRTKKKKKSYKKKSNLITRGSHKYENKYLYKRGLTWVELNKKKKNKKLGQEAIN